MAVYEKYISHDASYPNVACFAIAFRRPSLRLYGKQDHGEKRMERALAVDANALGGIPGVRLN